MPGVEVLGLLFAGKSRTTIQGPVEIPLDVAMAITHTYRNGVTSVPIEDGSEVNDHRVREPDGLTVEGIVTDHPVQVLGSLLSGSIGGAVGELLGADTPSKTAFDALMQANDEGAEVTVVTRFKTYSSMLITSLLITQARENGEALRFALELRRIVKVATATGSVAGLVDTVAGAADAAASRGDRSRQAGAAPTGAQSTRANDALARFVR